jgi:disulfide bond formation protein DsbB
MSDTLHPPRTSNPALTVTALLMAVVTVAGSLYLSGPMELKACPLCFYQRTFAMAVIGILFMGLLCGLDSGRLSLLALPSAIGGLGVAMFHVYLVQSGKLECPNGIFNLGPAPVQSLAAYALMLMPLLAAVIRTRALAFLFAVALGGVFVWASISFNPAPEKPTKPYADPPKTCRIPYVTSASADAP